MIHNGMTPFENYRRLGVLRIALAISDARPGVREPFDREVIWRRQMFGFFTEARTQVGNSKEKIEKSAGEEVVGPAGGAEAVVAARCAGGAEEEVQAKEQTTNRGGIGTAPRQRGRTTTGTSLLPLQDAQGTAHAGSDVVLSSERKRSTGIAASSRAPPFDRGTHLNWIVPATPGRTIIPTQPGLLRPFSVSRMAAASSRFAPRDPDAADFLTQNPEMLSATQIRLREMDAAVEASLGPKGAPLHFSYQTSDHFSEKNYVEALSQRSHHHAPLKEVAPALPPAYGPARPPAAVVEEVFQTDALEQTLANSRRHAATGEQVSACRTNPKSGLMRSRKIGLPSPIKWCT